MTTTETKLKESCVSEKDLKDSRQFTSQYGVGTSLDKYNYTDYNPYNNLGYSDNRLSLIKELIKLKKEVSSELHEVIQKKIEDLISKL